MTRTDQEGASTYVVRGSVLVRASTGQAHTDKGRIASDFLRKLGRSNGPSLAHNDGFEQSHLDRDSKSGIL